MPREASTPAKPSPVLLLLGIALVLFAAVCALTPIESHDLWWHLRTGDLVLRQGRPPAQNLFSFTDPRYPWVTHEWLTEAVFFWMYRHIGPDALVALKLLVVGAAFGVTYWTACREGGSAWAAAGVTAVAAYAARFTLDIRPQIFTLLFAALTLAAISRHRREGDRAIYGLVPLFCLWANMHSGFVVGLGLLALAAATMPERRGSLAWVFALSAVAALVTPNHWKAFWFPLTVSRTRLFTETLTEWFSPDFHEQWLWGLEGLLLGALAILALSPLRPRAFELGTLLGFGHLTLQHQRHVTLFALAATPVLARHLAGVLGLAVCEPAAVRRVQVAGALVLILAAGGFLAVRARRTGAFAVQVQQEVFPVAAVRYLEKRPPVRLYNAYQWGGYVIWRLYPKWRVFVDGRADAYSPKVLEDYLAVKDVRPGWPAILDRYHIRCILYLSGDALSTALLRHPQWRRVYSDGLADVFVRR